MLKFGTKITTWKYTGDELCMSKIEEEDKEEEEEEEEEGEEDGENWVSGEF